MYIWKARCGAADGVRTGIHVGVELLVNILRPADRRRVILFSLLCGALFTGIVAVFGAAFVSQIFETGQHSNDLEAPMWIVYLAIPVGSGLMCLRFLQVAWSFASTGELPHHDVSQVLGVEAAAGQGIAQSPPDPFHPIPPGPASLRKHEFSSLGTIVILAPTSILALC